MAATHLPFTPVTTARPPAGASASPRTPRRLVPGPAVIPMQGQVTRSRFSPAPRAFSHFAYAGDPYEQIERSRRPASSRPVTSLPSSPRANHAYPFKHCAVPTAPKHTGTFAVFTYDVDPFERRQAARKRAEQANTERMRGGAFIAGGRRKADKRAMHSRLPELLKGVHNTFRGDWLAFHSIAVDPKGYVLTHFSGENLTVQRRGSRHRFRASLSLLTFSQRLGNFP